MDARIPVGYSACPHDCPSTCALEVELLDERRIGRVRGAKDQNYTAGVICAKVARYAERVHHPDRLMYPLRRVGEKGGGEFERISWDDALAITAEAMLKAESQHGSEAVWPYYYAGTMGLVMRDGIHRLRHAKRYSGQLDTICSSISYAAWIAGHGKLRGADPREMAQSDMIVIWGTNPVNTQVNVMTHAVKARKERGAKLAVIDIYRNGTMEQADIGICLKPGTDAALACAIMHVLFRDDYADWDYLERFSDRPRDFERHLRSRTPEWASEITGLEAAEIETFAKLIGTTPKTFFRLGFGFTRSRNGAVSMHAASCIPIVTGAWRQIGGGAFHSNNSVFHINKTLIEGLDVRESSVRRLDMSQIGRVLTGDPVALHKGPPVTALFVQNVNPIAVAPEQRKVKAGFRRDDLFVAVHEQFMTDTAKFADVVMPATMFLEHDDFYQGGGHQFLSLGPKLIETPGECRSNHDVVCDLAKLVGAEHEGFYLSSREIIDRTLQASGWGGWADLKAAKWIDCQPPFEKAHFKNGFGYPDGKFRFAPDWANIPFRGDDPAGPVGDIPVFPDHWEVIEQADKTHPFRLATSPARGYLNTSFTETPTSRRREGAPAALIHPLDLIELGIEDGAAIRMGNNCGEIILNAKAFDGLRRGVVIVESIAPNHAFRGGEGINTLTGATQVAPIGGAAFHDNRVWIKPESHS